jgi:hypothetical protein
MPSVLPSFLLLNWNEKKTKNFLNFSSNAPPILTAATAAAVDDLVAAEQLG